MTTLQIKLVQSKNWAERLRGTLDGPSCLIRAPPKAVTALVAVTQSGAKKNRRGISSGAASTKWSRNELQKFLEKTLNLRELEETT